MSQREGTSAGRRDGDSVSRTRGPTHPEIAPVSTMTLVGVRSTAPSRGLVAILVENGGPAVLAVPVNAREGLLLSAGRSARSPSWTALLEQTCRALDGRIRSAELDVDADAALRACLVVSRDEREHRVLCTPGEALVVAQRLNRPVVASPTLLRLRDLDLAGDDLRLQLTRWRGELTVVAADEGAPPS